MKWITKLFTGDEPQVATEVSVAPVRTGDTHAELVQQNAALIHNINEHSGMLPPLGVVMCRRITDITATLLREADGSTMSINARVALHGVIGDYLPSTIRGYLVGARAGLRDETGLCEQLTMLMEESDALLKAQRSQDLHSLEAHSVFLHTKFTRSDLSL